MSPAWGVIGDAMTDAAVGYLEAVNKMPYEKAALRKAELENLRLESQTELDKARAAWELRRTSPGTGTRFKIGSDIVERDPDGNYKKVYEGPGKPLTPGNFLKDQALKALKAYFNKGENDDLTQEDLSTTDPVARGFIDIIQGKSEYDKGLPGTTYTPKSIIRGGSPETPATTPLTEPPAPSATTPVTDPPAPAPAPDRQPGAPAPAPAPASTTRPSPERPATVTKGTKPAVGPQATGVWADQYGSLNDAELAQEKALLDHMPPSPIVEAKKNALAQVQAKRQPREAPAPTTSEPRAPAAPTSTTQALATDPKLVQFHRTRFATVPKDQAVQEMQTVLKDPTLTEAQRTAKVAPMAEAYIAVHQEPPPGMETLVAPVQTGGSRTYTVPGGSAPAAVAAGATGSRVYTVPPSPEQQRESGRKEEDQAFQRREQARQEAELQLNELRYRLAMKEHDERVAARAQMTQQDLEGGRAQHDQAATANDLFVQGKITSPYYAQNSAEQKKLVDDTLAEPVKAAEARKVADAWREDQRLALAGQAAERDKDRLALDKDRLVISQQAHQREDVDRQLARQHQLEGGMHSREQSDMANDLYVQQKVDSPYYARNTVEHKKVINDTLRIPKDAEEARKAAGEWRAERGDIRAEKRETREEEAARLGGGVSKPQEMTTSILADLGKIEGSDYRKLSEKDKALVNRTIQQPDLDEAYRKQAKELRDQRKEGRAALKLAQPHLDELRALDTTRKLTEMIVPLLSTGNIGLMGKLKSYAGAALQYSPIGRSIFRREAEKALMDEAKVQQQMPGSPLYGKSLEGTLTENAIQARILANVEDDQGQAQRLTGLTAQSRLQTLSSVLVYAHAMAVKRGAGGTMRGLIKTDIDKAEKLFNPELFTKDPDQLLRNLQALQEFIQTARPHIEETIRSYDIDPVTKRFTGATSGAGDTLTLTPEQLKSLNTRR